MTFTHPATTAASSIALESEERGSGRYSIRLDRTGFLDRVSVYREGLVIGTIQPIARLNQTYYRADSPCAFQGKGFSNLDNAIDWLILRYERYQAIG